MRFAFFSCADYTHGYYNAYDLLEREDVDFVVCLGDYIYAESYHAKGKTGVRDDKIGKANSDNPAIVREAVSLADYRAKYALYRSDKTLRDLHAKFPMITTWDDHEVQDNYAGHAPGGGLDPSKHYTAAPQGRGLQGVLRGDAVLPARARAGSTARCASASTSTCSCSTSASTATTSRAATRPLRRAPSSTRRATTSAAPQMDWAKQRLASSGAAWKVIGNELMMMNAELPGGNYYGFDYWQGYAAEREELLAHIKAAGIKDVVFITGDIHTFIAGDVRTQKSRGESVALEFVGGSITSQSFGETDLPIGGGQVLKGNDANPNTAPAIIDALRAVNPWVDQADFDHHGYGVVEGRRQDVRRDAQARADDQEAVDGEAADHGLPLHGRPRPDVDQGRQRPAGELMNRRPRLELHGSSASPEEAAAVMAAIEQFLRDTAPPPGPGARAQPVGQRRAAGGRRARSGCASRGVG